MLLVLAVAASACGTDPAVRASQKEAQMRRVAVREAARVERDFGLLEAPELHAYLEELGSRLASNLPEPNDSWRYAIVDADWIDAFSLPGGLVFVTRGLLVQLALEDQLASVLAHEMAHVSAGHTESRLDRAAALRIGEALPEAAHQLVLPGTGRPLAMLGQLRTVLSVVPYAPEEESEAVRLAADTMVPAGWDSAGWLSFRHTLERLHALSGEAPPIPYERAHPLATPATPAAPRARPPDAAAFLARLEGLVVGPDPVQGLIEGRVLLHPDLGIRVAFPDGWTVQNGGDFVQATPPRGRARAVLGIASGEGDVMRAARAVAQGGAARFGLLPQETKIGGHRAARAVGHHDGAVLDVTWLVHGAQIYQISGLSHGSDYEGLQTAFIDVALGFRAISAEERAGIGRDVLQNVEGRAGETLPELVVRTGSRWSAAEVAVANAIPPESPLEAGMLLKVPLRRPYPEPTSADTTPGSPP